MKGKEQSSLCSRLSEVSQLALALVRPGAGQSSVCVGVSAWWHKHSCCFTVSSGLPSSLLLSLPPPLHRHPRCLKRTIYQRSTPFQNIYSLRIGSTQRPFSYSLLMSNIQTNLAPTCTWWLHLLSITHSLDAAHARTHLFTVGDSSLSESSICFVPFTDFEVACECFFF